MNWRYNRFVAVMILMLLILVFVFVYVPGKEEDGKKLSRETTSEVKEKEVKTEAVKEECDAPADQSEVEPPSKETPTDETKENQKKEGFLEEINTGKDTVTKDMTEPSQATEVPPEENKPLKNEKDVSDDKTEEMEKVDEVKVNYEEDKVETGDSVAEEQEQTVTIQVPIYEEKSVYWIKDDSGSVIYKSTDPKEWENKILFYAENAVKTTYGQNGVEIVTGYKAPDTIPVTVWENSSWYGNEDVIVTYNQNP